MDDHQSLFIANLAAAGIADELPDFPALSVGIPSNQGLPGIQFVLPAIPSTIPDDMTDEAREEVYDTVVSMSLSMAQKAAINARSVQSHVNLLRLMDNFTLTEKAAAVVANQDVVPPALMGSSTSSAQLQLEAPKQEAIVPATRPLGQKVEDTAHVLPKPIDDARDAGSSEVTKNAAIISDTTNDVPNLGLPQNSPDPSDIVLLKLAILENAQRQMGVSTSDLARAFGHMAESLTTKAELSEVANLPESKAGGKDEKKPLLFTFDTSNPILALLSDTFKERFAYNGSSSTATTDSSDKHYKSENNDANLSDEKNTRQKSNKTKNEGEDAPSSSSTSNGRASNRDSDKAPKATSKKCHQEAQKPH